MKLTFRKKEEDGGQQMTAAMLIARIFASIAAFVLVTTLFFLLVSLFDGLFYVIIKNRASDECALIWATIISTGIAAVFGALIWGRRSKTRKILMLSGIGAAILGGVTLVLAGTFFTMFYVGITNM